MNRNSLLFVRIQTLTQSIHHHKQKEITDIACKTTNGISFGPTWDEKSHMVKDNTIVKGKSIVNHKDWHFRFHYQLIGKERKIYPAGGGTCCDILWTETLGWRITSTGILSWAITTCCEGLCSDPMLMMFGGGRGILTLCWGCETGLRSEPMVRGGILARCCCWGCETSLRSEPIVRGGILALCCCCCCWGCELGLSMFGAGILALCCSGSFPCATIIWR